MRFSAPSDGGSRGMTEILSTACGGPADGALSHTGKYSLFGFQLLNSNLTLTLNLHISHFSRLKGCCRFSLFYLLRQWFVWFGVVQWFKVKLLSVSYESYALQ